MKLNLQHLQPWETCFGQDQESWNRVEDFSPLYTHCLTLSLSSLYIPTTVLNDNCSPGKRYASVATQSSLPIFHPRFGSRGYPSPVLQLSNRSAHLHLHDPDFVFHLGWRVCKPAKASNRDPVTVLQRTALDRFGNRLTGPIKLLCAYLGPPRLQLHFELPLTLIETLRQS